MWYIRLLPLHGFQLQMSLSPSAPDHDNVHEYQCRDDKIAEKRTLHLPKILKNVIHCKNPRCITSIEQELPHIFYLDDKDHEVYRCRYCDEKHS